MSFEDELDVLFSAPCLAALKEASFTPLLPPAIKAKRTVLLFGVDDNIRRKEPEEIVAELCYPSSLIVKVVFRGTSPAIKATEQGLKMFNIRVPPHRIQREEYVPITICMRCYALASHQTQDCSKPRENTVCSECSEEGHLFTTCPSSSKKCLNCGESHRTLAYKCLERRKAVATAKAEKKSRTYSSVAASAAAPPQLSASAFPAMSPKDMAKVFICVAHAHHKDITHPGSYELVLNATLTTNNLPTIIIPDIPLPLLTQAAKPQPADTPAEAPATIPAPISPVQNLESLVPDLPSRATTPEPTRPSTPLPSCPSPAPTPPPTPTTNGPNCAPPPRRPGAPRPGRAPRPAGGLLG